MGGRDGCIQQIRNVDVVFVPEIWIFAPRGVSFHLTGKFLDEQN